jgi:hypothetical protein
LEGSQLHKEIVASQPKFVEPVCTEKPDAMDDLLLDSVSTTVVELPVSTPPEPFKPGKLSPSSPHHFSDIAPTQEESCSNMNYSAELEASEHRKDDGRINLGDALDEMFAIDDDCCIIEVA